MPDEGMSAAPRNGGNGRVGAEVEELRRELDRRQEEILRLRDLLIAKDAELGAARGRLAELAAYSARLAVATHVLRAKLPQLLRRLAAKLARRRD